MKRLFMLTLTAILILFVTASSEFTYAEEAEEKIVTIPVSFTYTSVYWWRGIELDGDGVGVLWPGVGIKIRDISLGCSAGISEDWIVMEDSESEDNAGALTEVDYGISYSKKIGLLSLGIGAMYCNFPFYDYIDNSADPSFIEATLSFGIDTILSPSIEMYYDYYVEARKGEDGKDVPVAEDYYLRLSVFHKLAGSEDGFSLGLGAWAGYYNNPYMEMKGWSDAGLLLGLTEDYENLSMNSSFNYGRTIGKDFKDYNNGIKNHFWCDFSVAYLL